MIALFSFARLAIQFFVFDAKAYLRNPWLRLGYYGLTVSFAYLAAAFGWAAWGEDRRDTNPKR